MAPIRKRPTARTRAERSARDPRGIYAPPSSTTSTSANEEPAFHSLHHQPPLTQQPTLFSLDNDDDAFKLSKKDKRTVKHSALLAKVRDAGVSKKKPLKRRRPAKKLAGGDLGGLGDALPSLTPSGTNGGEEGEDSDGWEGISDDEEGGEAGMEVDGLRKASTRRRRRKVNKVGSAAEGGNGKMVMKTLQHKPGAAKKKLRMERGEMERFGRNLAQMVGSAPATQQQEGRGGEGGGGDGGKAVGQQEKWAALRRFIGGTMEVDGAFATA